jgi:hypothetical protein
VAAAVSASLVLKVAQHLAAPRAAAMCAAAATAAAAAEGPARLVERAAGNPRLKKTLDTISWNRTAVGTLTHSAGQAAAAAAGRKCHDNNRAAGSSSWAQNPLLLLLDLLLLRLQSYLKLQLLLLQ